MARARVVATGAHVAQKKPHDTAVDRLKLRMMARFEAEKDKPRDLRRSQSDLAEKLGISRSTLNEALSGDSARRGLLHHLDTIADYFNVTPSLLVHRNDTNLIELRGDEYRFVSHLRQMPPAVREQLLLLLDFFAGLLPEEREHRRIWMQLRALRPERRAVVLKTLDDQMADQRRTRQGKDTGPAAQGSAEQTPRASVKADGKTTKTARVGGAPRSASEG